MQRSRWLIIHVRLKAILHSTTVAFERHPWKRALGTKHSCGIITWMDLEVDSFSAFLKWRPCGYCACRASSKQPWFPAQCKTAQQQRIHSRVRLCSRSGLKREGFIENASGCYQGLCTPLSASEPANLIPGMKTRSTNVCMTTEGASAWMHIRSHQECSFFLSTADCNGV